MNFILKKEKKIKLAVSDLLEETDLHVVVYQGQMDIICCTRGKKV